MADEENLSGNNGDKLADMRARLKVDGEQLAKLKKGLDDLTASAKNLGDYLKTAADHMERLAVASGKKIQTGGGVGGGSSAPGTVLNAEKARQEQETKTGGSGSGGGSGGGDGGGGFMGYLSRMTPSGARQRIAGSEAASAHFGQGTMIAQAITQAIKPLVRQMDQRIGRGMSYATGADRLNVLTQQMTGMSQMDVMRNMRQPMTGARLGAGGINAMMQFQAETGVQATAGLAQSVAGIRASTGYSKSTADILQEQRNLMAPEVANRMFYMTGVNAYTIGGGANDPMKMRQQLVQSLGLTNKTSLEGAMGLGSVTRARLRDMGLDETMQTELLQYAQQNLTFQEKGGQGMYDPSKKQDRERMGIEENFATQQEETSRVQTAREEQFLTRQIDNMADQEKANQKIIELLGKMEDHLSGLVGARTSTMPLAKSVGGLAGGMGMAAMMGSALMKTPNPYLMGAGIVLNVAGKVLGGDPNVKAYDGLTANAATTTPFNPTTQAVQAAMDDQIKAPYGWNGNMKTLSEIKNDPTFQKIDPSFRNRLMNMMRDSGGRVGIGESMRTTEAQEREFYRRHHELTQSEIDAGVEADREWNGKLWKLNEGEVGLAPPGHSYHEIGLAVDLTGDTAWAVANAAKYGLTHFASLSEPWHFQPAEIPRSRVGGNSVASGSGSSADMMARSSGGGTSTTYSSRTRSGRRGRSVGRVGNSLSSSFLSVNSGGSISDIINQSMSSSLAAFQAAAKAGNATADNIPASDSGAPSRAGATNNRRLSGSQVADFAYGAGFRGSDLVTAVAIAGRESSWMTGAHNPNRSTGDDSYGLMQINMIDSLEAYRLQLFGINDKQDLFDPATNMRAAHKLYSYRDNSFYDWGGYKGNANDYSTDRPAALAAVREAGYDVGGGDPPSPVRYSAGRGSVTNNVTSAPTINVSPVINFNGSPSTPDLRNIAETVSRMIKDEVDMLMMRSA